MEWATGALRCRRTSRASAGSGRGTAAGARLDSMRRARCTACVKPSTVDGSTTCSSLTAPFGLITIVSDTCPAGSTAAWGIIQFRITCALNARATPPKSTPLVSNWNDCPYCRRRSGCRVARPCARCSARGCRAHRRARGVPGGMRAAIVRSGDCDCPPAPRSGTTYWLGRPAVCCRGRRCCRRRTAAEPVPPAAARPIVASSGCLVLPREKRLLIRRIGRALARHRHPILVRERRARRRLPVPGCRGSAAARS